MTILTAAGLGCAGALLPDLIRIAKSHYDPSLPAFLKTGHFWLSLAAMLVLGALAGALLKPDRVLEALAFGYGAPEILSRALAKAPEDNPPPAGPPLGGGTSTSIRNWWSH